MWCGKAASWTVPATSTQPSRRSLISASRPGQEAAVLQQLERLVVALERLRDAHDVHRSDRRVGEQDRVRVLRLVARAGDRVAVRAGARVAELLDQLGLDVGGDDAVVPGRLVVHLPPLEPDEVGEHPFHQPVAAHGGPGVLPAGRRQLDPAVSSTGRLGVGPGDEVGDRCLDVSPGRGCARAVPRA
jgi:hypothetical protein